MPRMGPNNVIIAGQLLPKHPLEILDVRSLSEEGVQAPVAQSERAAAAERLERRLEERRAETETGDEERGDRRLLIFEQAQRELAQANTVDEVIDIRNKAIGLVAYAKEAKSRQLALEAKQICMFAERRLGQMMKEQKKTLGLNRGGRPKTGLSENPVSFKPTLDEAGIDKNLAHRARSLAAMSEKEFEKQVAATSAAMWPPRKQRQYQPSPSILGLADQCVASVRKTVERTTAEMQRGHAARPKFKHLFSALTNVITDLERETLPYTERPRINDRNAS